MLPGVGSWVGGAGETAGRDIDGDDDDVVEPLTCVREADCVTKGLSPLVAALAAPEAEGDLAADGPEVGAAGARR